MNYKNDGFENCLEYCGSYFWEKNCPCAFRVPKDEDETSVIPSLPNLIAKKSSTIIPYTAKYFYSLYTDSITGKPRNLMTFAFGQNSEEFWFENGDSIELLNAKRDAIHSFVLPKNIDIERIIASARIQYDTDFKDNVFVLKLRMYRSDLDEDIFKYIEGTQVEFTPNISGKIKADTHFIARGNDLNVAVEENSKLAIGIFLEGKENQDEYDVEIKFEAGLAISTQNEGVLRPSTPPVSAVKQLVTIPYTTEHSINIQCDNKTGLAVLLNGLGFGSYPSRLYISEGNVDFLTQDDSYALQSFILPRAGRLKSIAAQFQSFNQEDATGAGVTIKGRIFTFSQEDDKFKYLEGSEFIFTPDYEGEIKKYQRFEAYIDNLNVRINQKERVAFCIFGTCVINSEYASIYGKVDGSISIELD